jgi:hypothetical protein
MDRPQAFFTFGEMMHFVEEWRRDRCSADCYKSIEQGAANGLARIQPEP